MKKLVVKRIIDLNVDRKSGKLNTTLSVNDTFEGLQLSLTLAVATALKEQLEVALGQPARETSPAMFTIAKEVETSLDENSRELHLRIERPNGEAAFVRIPEDVLWTFINDLNSAAQKFVLKPKPVRH